MFDILEKLEMLIELLVKEKVELMRLFEGVILEIALLNKEKEPYKEE
jgi:hypothetical protein